MSATGAAGVDVASLDTLLAQVSGERMAGTVAALAGDRFAGRRVGSVGNARARTWLADRLRADGATVTTTTFTAPAVPTVYERPSVRWRHGTTTDLVFGRDVAIHLASADVADVRAGAIGVAGRDAPEGRWLLVPSGMDMADAYGRASGAAGLLVCRSVDADGWQYTMLAGPHPGPLPVLTLETSVHDRMAAASVEGTATLSANAPIRRTDVTGTNLHARYRPGDGPAAPDLLLTAHFDGVGDHPGLRQPSAADNGSGVAVVCEAARVLAPVLPPGVGLSVALLDGEEVGALGSARHAGQLRAAGAAPVVVNVDGAGRMHGAVAVEAGGPAHGLLAVLDRAGRHTGVPLAAGPVASDNRRYAAAGLAAVGLGAGMAGYHSPADTPDRVDPRTLTALGRLVVATVALAAGSADIISSSIGDER